MATAKKATSKKSTPTKPVAKKTAKATSVKKVTTKKPPTKKVATQAAAVRSFKITRDTQPFQKFAITRQTIYWIILIAFIIFAQLWILKLQIEVASLIDAQQAQLMSY